MGSQEADDEASPPGDEGTVPDDEGPSRVPPWLRSLRAAARASALKPAQVTGLLAAAELDEERPRQRRLGYRHLLAEYCERGRRHWLDPAKALSPLSLILERYQGESTTLRFVMVELFRLAKAGLSPDAFIRHVVVPRMADDMDWRHWRSRHGEAIAGIAGMLADMRGSAPFDSDRLGETGVVTDIALCKYVGRPLCRLSGEQWRALEPELESYRKAWSGFAFGNRHFLLFLRRNVFPFLYGLSGLIDPQQLVPVIEAAAALEEPFSARFSRLPPETADRVLDQGALYGDFEAYLAARRAGGASWISFARLLRGYLGVAKALLSTNAGISLLGWFARLLRGSEDESLPRDLSELIACVRDSGGVAALVWHARRMRGMAAAERRAFIDQVTRSGGLAFDYPYRFLFIPREDDEDDLRSGAAARLAVELGLAPSLGTSLSEKGLSIKTVFKAFSKSSIEREALARDFLSGAAACRERSWTDEEVARFDREGRGVHELLMRRLMPGLGSGFSIFALKTPDLAGLRLLYRAADSMSCPRVEQAFTLREGKDSSESGLDALSRDELRKRINLDFIGRTASVLIAVDFDAKEEEAYESETFAALGSLQREVRKGLEPLEERLAKADEDIARSRDDPKRSAESTKASGKLRKQVQAARERLALFDAAFALRDEDLKPLPAGRFALGLHAASYVGKSLEPACASALAWLCRRHADGEARRRLEFLKTDLSPDFVTLEQLSMIVDLLDRLCAAAAADDSTLAAMAADSDDFRAFLAKTSPLSGRSAPAESMDAAARKCAGAARLEAERTKWKEYVDRLSRDEREAKRYAVRTSKSFLDAYYGDMGGICLSSSPDMVLRPGFLNLRLIDEAEGQIVGMALAAFAVSKRASFGFDRYWLAFAFNPLKSLAKRWNSRQLLLAYLSFRRVLETLASESGHPVLISGIGAQGLLSNNPTLQSLILNYEISGGASVVRDAYGFSLLYPEEQYANAILVVQPGKASTFRSEKDIPPLVEAESRPPRPLLPA